MSEQPERQTSVSGRPRIVRRVLRPALLVLALGFAVWFLIPRLPELGASLAQLDVWQIAASSALAFVAVVITYVAWFVLVHSGDGDLTLRNGTRMFFLSQLGKYLPGAVWPIVAQAEFGREHRLPPLRTASAGTLALLTSAITGTIIGVALVPLSVPNLSSWWSLLAIPACALLLLLHPRILHGALAVLSRITRRTLVIEPIGLRSLGRAAVLSTASWIVFGAHLWVLFPEPLRTHDLSMLLAIGGYAASWVGGLALVFLPAGLVGREAALILILGWVYTAPGFPLSAVLVSRVIITLLDIALAGVAAISAAIARSRGAAPL